MRSMRPNGSLCVAMFCVLARSRHHAGLESRMIPPGILEMDVERRPLWRFSGDATPPDCDTNHCRSFSPIRTGRRMARMRPFFGAAISSAPAPGFSLLYATIVCRPEHHFVGGSASASWNGGTREDPCLVLLQRGGVGWLDSKGPPDQGAQGEDFKLNWLGYTAYPISFRNRFERLGRRVFPAYFNRNLNSVNPALTQSAPW